MLTNALRLFSRLILGLTFVFSGFVKAVDPLGSAYKLSDYFAAFNMEFLDALSLPLGIFLAAFELVLGIVLILGYQKKIVTWVLLVFMSFFTLLTLFLAIFNPVSDCGCFGDAIIMTNWETFFKNLVLMVFVLFLFLTRKNDENVFRPACEYLLIAVFFAGSFLLSVNCLRHLPLIDFRAYDRGTDIRSEMEIPEDAPRDVYETKLFYKNLESGKEKEFTLENYPKDTLIWEFVTSESRLVKKGYEPPIHDFGLTDNDGYDITDELLDDPNYTLLMISYDLEKAEKDMLQKMNEWEHLQSIAADFSFIPLTATSTVLRDEIINELGLDYEFFTADQTMLKTVVRSNPGFLLMRNGVILDKWSYRDFPDMTEWNEKWPELIAQYLAEQDPEILMLIEEGFMEDIEWNLVDFDKSALQLTVLETSRKSELRAWLLFYASLIIITLLLQLTPIRKIFTRG